MPPQRLLHFIFRLWPLRYPATLTHNHVRPSVVCWRPHGSQTYVELPDDYLPTRATKSVEAALKAITHGEGTDRIVRY